MKEREAVIDGRSRNRFESVFQPDNFLLVLQPVFPNISSEEISQREQKKSILLEKELGLKIKHDHYESLFLAIADNNLVGAYLIEACRYPLLTPNQEQILAQRITAGIGAISLLKQPSWRQKKHNPHNPLAEIAFDGTAARRLLTNCNFRLVVSIAWKSTGRGVPFNDLIQAGNLHLIQAVEGFRPNIGKFVSYAKPAIERALKKEIAKNGYIFRLPANQERLVRRMYGLREHLTVKLGREPTDEEIAARLEIDPEKVRKLIEISKQPISLDVPLSDDEGRKSLYGLIRDDKAVEPEEAITRQDVREQVGRIIASLPNLREKLVVEKHWGLNGYHPHTLDEIGEELGITGERVRQIEVKVFKKLLSHPVYRRKLRALF